MLWHIDDPEKAHSGVCGASGPELFITTVEEDATCAACINETVLVLDKKIVTLKATARVIQRMNQRRKSSRAAHSDNQE